MPLPRRRGDQFRQVMTNAAQAIQRLAPSRWAEGGSTEEKTWLERKMGESGSGRIVGNINSPADKRPKG
jgi:hypothetical protein